MTVWFCDPLNGTDSSASAGNGDSFATRRKRINNFVAAATAPGDTIRIMGSPAPTSLGVTGIWTNGPHGDTITPTSSTNATPIVMTKAGHGLVTGDVIVVSGHAVNTKANGVWDVTVSGDNFTLLHADGTNSVGNGSGGASGTFRKITNSIVTLSAAVTKNIALFGNRSEKTNWTASSNVTASILTTDYKEGAECQRLSISSTFTTGLAAHYPLGVSTDYSAYQQITFWIKQTSGILGASGSIQMKLCSDTAGVTAVDTFDIPALVALNRWLPVTVDKGSALGATIQSVAFYVVTDNGAQAFSIDNIQASKAASSNDSLSMQSLITKNTGTEASYCLQSINGTRLIIDGETNTMPTDRFGYFGTTETVTTYKRETWKTALASSSSSAVQTAQEAGTSGSLITYSGGWDATAMSTQNLETWLDGANGYGYGLVLLAYNACEKINTVRYNRGISTAADNTSGTCQAIVSCSGYGIFTNGTKYSDWQIDNVINCGASIGDRGSFTATLMSGASVDGLVVGSGNVVTVGSIKNYTNYGVSFVSANDNICYIDTISYGVYGVFFNASNNNKFFAATISGNSTASVGETSTDDAEKNYFINCVLSDTVEVVPASAGRSLSGGIYSHGQDGDANKHICTLLNGTIMSDTSVRHTASGISWKLSPTTTTFVTSDRQFYMPVARVAVGAGTLVTVSLWMRRTNTGITARLMCKGKQIAGVSTDVYTNMTAGADTWEQVTITFTPTTIGVVEIVAECYGGTTYSLYVDDFDVSQA